MTVKQMKEILNKIPDDVQFVDLEAEWEDDYLLNFVKSVPGLIYYPGDKELYLYLGKGSQRIREINEDYDYDTEGITYLAEN